MTIKQLPPPNAKFIVLDEKQSVVEALRYQIARMERKLKRCTSPTSEARVCAAISALCTRIDNIIN